MSASWARVWAMLGGRLLEVDDVVRDFKKREEKTMSKLWAVTGHVESQSIGPRIIRDS